MTREEITAALDAAPVLPGAPVRERPLNAGPVRRVRVPDWEHAFCERAVAIDGGHLHWTGATGTKGTPVLCVAGKRDTALRLAFRWHNKREPVGKIRRKRACNYAGCVAGGHLADRLMRQEGAA